MPITNRKPRPLARDKQTYRDDKLIIIACDDTYAPKQYFQVFRIPRVQIHVLEAQDGKNSAEWALQRLLDIEHAPIDERWLLLDTDHYTQGPHLQSFTRALARARQSGVRVALSKHCFEVWLLLHFAAVADLPDFVDCAAVDGELRRVLGQYNKTSLDTSKFPFSSIALAFRRARELDQTVLGGEIPSSVTTRVYQILDSIFSSIEPSQLPEEFRGLVIR